MKIMVNSSRSAKGGFTIVELVVALAIILIMSIAATSTIASQNNIYRSTLYTTEATNLAENAVECFRFADDAQAFVDAYKETGVTLEGEDGKYTFEQSGLKVSITINAETLTFKAVTADSEKLILEKSYTK